MVFVHPIYSEAAFFMHPSNPPPCRITDSQQCKKKDSFVFFLKPLLYKKKSMIQNFKNFTVVQESVGTSFSQVCVFPGFS